MSFLNSLTQPSTDISAFFRSLISYPHGGSSSSTRSYEAARPTSEINLFASSLSGQAGAHTILRALERNPSCQSLSVANNPLRDDGVRELVIGIKRLRSNGVGSKLRDLNMSGCEITDIGLHLIVLHLLTPSPHPPTIRSLYLANNVFHLAPWLCAFMSSTLSSPESSVRCLSLNTNPTISSAGFLSFITSLNLSLGSRLTVLHFSLCDIGEEVVDSLVSWLSDRTEGGGRGLQILCMNGNSLGSEGVRRIEETIVNGEATGMIHFEGYANSVGKPEGDLVDMDVWELKLKRAKERNKVALKETRLSALALLGPARILLLPSTGERPSSVTKFQFNFAGLPPEIRTQILYALLTPSSVAHNYSPIPTPSTHSIFPLSPLTTSQFLRVISYASNRSTMSREIQLASSGGGTVNLGGGRRQWGLALQETEMEGQEERDEKEGWESWFLQRVGCDRFERC